MSDIDDMEAAIKRAANNQWRSENREATRAYDRAYYAKTKEKRRELQRRAYAELSPEIRTERAANQKQWVKDHPEARKETQQRYRKRNKEEIARANREYTNTPKVRQRIRNRAAETLENRAGRPKPDHCDACGGPPDKGKSLHFDHCHRHGHFRGWICRECNLVLGHVDDDTNRLLKLVAYIKRNKIGTTTQFPLPGL